MSAANTRAQAWWTTAPNPPCRPWCTATAEHRKNEFARAGSMECRKAIGSADWFTVEVAQIQSVDDADTPGVIESLPAIVWEWASRGVDECTAAEVKEYATALLEAVAFIEERAS